MIKRLLYLNGLAILGVLLYHASGWGFVALFWWTDRYQAVSAPNFGQVGSAEYFLLRFIEQLGTAAVPAFLFVSGFFVAFATGRSQRTIGWNVVGSRIKNLLIPYLLWSLAFFAVDAALGNTYSLAIYLRRLLLGQATESFYYVPLLVQFFLLSPLLVPIARRRWKTLLAVAAVVQLGLHLLRYLQYLGPDSLEIDRMLGVATSRFFPGHLLYFSVGLVIGFHLPAAKQLLERCRWALLIATPALLMLSMVEWELLLRQSGQDWLAPAVTVMDDLYSLAFVLTVLAFERVTLPLTKPMGDLGTRSYGIYLSNALVLMLVAKAIYRLTPGLLDQTMLFVAILITLGLAVPLAMMALVNRTPARRYYRYIFG
jgi:peptidoglycan/LPS O-acetylase OafA/YrhL